MEPNLRQSTSSLRHAVTSRAPMWGTTASCVHGLPLFRCCNGGTHVCQLAGLYVHALGSKWRPTVSCVTCRIHTDQICQWTTELWTLPCEGDPVFEFVFGATNSIDVGLLFGAGVDVRLGPGMLSGDLRYDLGLTDVTEADWTLKNRSIETLVGYAFIL